MKKSYHYTQVTNKIKALPVLVLLFFASCTKYEDGFLSPYFQYPSSDYTIAKGRAFTSDAINPDGSSIPFKVKLSHAYDENGNIVDELFTKTYPVTIWTSSYNTATDTTVELLNAKRKVEQLPAIAINENNGAIESNTASVNLPSGAYTLDLEISNAVGTQVLKKVVTIHVEEADPYESSPGLSATSEGLIQVGNESASIGLGALPVMSVEKTADEPWIINVKMVDKNGFAFNPAAGEIVKRPATGLNPVPPFLQNLQYYTNSYEATSDQMKFPYAVVPMPLQSLGNGYNMYYRIPTKYVHIDNYPDDAYTCNVRFALRIWVPGSYNITVKVPNITHR